MKSTSDIPEDGPLAELIIDLWQMYRITWYSPKRADPPRAVALWLPDGAEIDYKAPQAYIKELVGLSSDPDLYGRLTADGWGPIDDSKTSMRVYRTHFLPSVAKAVRSLENGVKNGKLDRLMIREFKDGTAYYTCDIYKFSSRGMDVLRELTGVDKVWQMMGFTDACRCSWPM